MAELARYGVARDFYLPLPKQGSTDYAAGADYTYAAGDIKVIVDGVAANITTAPTAVTSGNTTIWKFPLSATELTGKEIEIVVGDAATKVVQDQTIRIETYGHELSMHPHLGIEVAIFGKFVTGTLSNQTGTTNLTQGNDILNRRRLIVLSGSLAGEQTHVADYDTTSGQVYFMNKLSGAPANNDRFIII
jgi:hypothetical protein